MMKKSFVMILLLMCFMTGCAAQATEQAADSAQQLPMAAIEIVFDGEVAPVLATEDDYIKAFSTFDYAGKFKTETPLNYNQRLQMYSSAIEPYTDKEKQRILKAYETVLQGMAGIECELPPQIMVFSDGTTESGEAYTRQNAVNLPKKMMRFMSDKRLTNLIAHETFHVISRYNQDDHEAWYKILGYRKVNEMIWPDEMKALTIANPDAPQNNYVIRCQYNNQEYDFMPVIYANSPYELSSNKSFFKYLQEGMVAVEVVEGNPKPVYVDGKMLIVEKSDLVGFIEQVGKNTKYSIHPEETTADHFAMLITDSYKKAPNPEKIQALKKLVYNGK